MPKTFFVQTEANAADPAWQIACIDISNGTKDLRQFSTFDELKKLIDKAEYDRAFAAGYASMSTEVCDMFGVSWPELVKIAEEYREQDVLDVNL